MRMALLVFMHLAAGQAAEIQQNILAQTNNLTRLAQLLYTDSSRSFRTKPTVAAAML
jgi:hypothetical protein